MSDRIGPTFEAELLAAGTPLDGLSWDRSSGAISACPADLLARVQAVLAAHDPSKTLPPSTVTGNQWAFALGDLGLAAAWRAAAAKSKDKDQIRVDLIGRDTRLLATDPLLARVAAQAGIDAAGVAVIDPARVFAKALTEPT